MQHPSPLGVASSVTLLTLDWALYVLASADPQRAATTTVMVAMLTALLTYMLERESHGVEFAPRSLRALGAGLAVAIPLPIYGSLLATATAVWTWLAGKVVMNGTGGHAHCTNVVVRTG